MLNRVIRKPSLHDIKRQNDGTLAVGRFRNLPDMSTNESLCPTAAFLGSHADNSEVLAELASEALASIVNFRTELWQGPKLHLDAEHDESIKALKSRFTQLLHYLENHSTPFSSLRYIAHMTGDQLLPAHCITPNSFIRNYYLLGMKTYLKRLY